MVTGIEAVPLALIVVGGPRWACPPAHRNPPWNGMAAACLVPKAKPVLALRPPRSGGRLRRDSNPRGGRASELLRLVVFGSLCDARATLDAGEQFHNGSTAPQPIPRAARAVERIDEVGGRPEHRLRHPPAVGRAYTCTKGRVDKISIGSGPAGSSTVVLSPGCSPSMPAASGAR